MKIKIKDKRKKEGFSLIEVIVSVGIFTIIIGGVVLFGARSIEAYTRSRAMQSSLENTRYAIEGLSKRIRTSNSLVPDTFGTSDDEIFIIDNVDASKHCYRFDDNQLEVAKVYYDGGNPTPYNNATSCASFGDDDFDVLVGNSKVDVDGLFYIKGTDLENQQRGLVQLIFNLSHNDPSISPAEKDSIVIQSSVSLKDYDQL